MDPPNSLLRSPWRTLSRLSSLRTSVVAQVVREKSSSATRLPRTITAATTTANDLSRTFHDYLAHAPVPSLSRPRRIVDESKSPVHVHYASVVSVLGGIMDSAIPSPSMLADSEKQHLPSRKWAVTAADELRTCRDERDLLAVFEHFYIRGELDRETAREILWSSRLRSAEAVERIAEFTTYSTSLAGWSPHAAHGFALELLVKRIVLRLRAAGRNAAVDEDDAAVWRAYSAATFENVFVPAMENSYLSNDAIRSVWYLIAVAEAQFDIVGRAVYAWLALLRDEKVDAVKAVSTANAVAQMWITGATTRNKHLQSIASSFLTAPAAARYLPPATVFAVKFIDSILSLVSPTEKQLMTKFAKMTNLLKSPPTDNVSAASTQQILVAALDIHDQLRAEAATTAAALITKFVAENNIFARKAQAPVAIGAEVLSDALLTKRLRKVVAKPNSVGTGSADLSDDIVWRFLSAAVK
ncbi:uncharacterized protein V1518DRAFT_373220 [Limtongia smithiae]|uniref:uncharacterized protein n=1 Tax=Limtongia smithiae TaxID=1125753 RepID=UPI0034CF3A28